MNILILTTDFPYPERNGFRYSIMETVRMLYEGGHEVTLMGVTDVSESFRLTELPENYRLWADYYCVELQIIMSKTREYANFFFDKHSLEPEKYNSDVLNAELEKVLKSKSFDIVQVENIILSQYLPLIRQHSTAKVVLRVHQFRYPLLEKLHNQANGIIQKPMTREALIRWLQYEWTILTQGFYDKILTFNPDLTQIILSKITELKGKATSVHTLQIGWDSADLPDVNPEIQRKPQSIVYMGSLNYAPNKSAFISFMHKVWLPLRKHFPEAKLHVAAFAKPQEFDNNWGETEGVHWEGKLDNLYEFLQDKAIMVLPMYNYDGFQQRVWEGMAMGCAVVASPLALGGLAVRHGDNIFIAPDEKKFRFHLGTLLEHPNIALALGKHAEICARTELTRTNAIQALEKIYK